MVMAEARQRAAWARTSLLAALVWNCAYGRDPDDAKDASDFDPFHRKPKDEELPEAPIEALKALCMPHNVRYR